MLVRLQHMKILEPHSVHVQLKVLESTFIQLKSSSFIPCDFSVVTVLMTEEKNNNLISDQSYD